MKILLITRSFAPDSSIASKRLSYFAKYLSEYGHEIYVIRSGLIFFKPDTDLAENTRKCHIFSYEGQNSDAECYDRGDYFQKDKNSNKSSVMKTVSPYREFAKSIYHNVRDISKFYIQDGRRIRDKILSIYNDTPELRSFDIVLSTFSPVGCLQAGRIISQREGCKWIVDFRDLMDNSTLPQSLRIINNFAQKKYLKQADYCLCVSYGNAVKLASEYKGKYAEKVFCVYNGYINQPMERIPIFPEKKLRICYTGTLHSGKRCATPLFKALKRLNIPAEDVIIDYAGKECDVLIKDAESFGYAGSVINHNVLSRTETSQLQASSDLFLVISWNTKNDQGILTGKFYEALQHKKPIIAIVSGDVPNSELKMLIDTYNLGICYEEATKEESEDMLKDYVFRQYRHKQAGKMLDYSPDPEVFNQFEYGNIVKKLEKIMM